MVNKKQVLTFGNQRFIVPNNVRIELLVEDLLALQSCDWEDNRTYEEYEVSARIELDYVKYIATTDDKELTNESN